MTQAIVSGLVPQKVIESLEVIDIDHQQGKRRAVPVSATTLLFQDLIEAAPVGETSQSVNACKGLQSKLRFVLDGDVA